MSLAVYVYFFLPNNLGSSNVIKLAMHSFQFVYPSMFKMCSLERQTPLNRQTCIVLTWIMNYTLSLGWAGVVYFFAGFRNEHH
jgi:hypothetical protein